MDNNCTPFVSKFVTAKEALRKNPTQTKHGALSSGVSHSINTLFYLYVLQKYVHLWACFPKMCPGDLKLLFCIQKLSSFCFEFNIHVTSVSIVTQPTSFTSLVTSNVTIIINNGETHWGLEITWENKFTGIGRWVLILTCDFHLSCLFTELPLRKCSDAGCYWNSLHLYHGTLDEGDGSYIVMPIVLWCWFAVNQ